MSTFVYDQFKSLFLEREFTRELHGGRLPAAYEADYEEKLRSLYAQLDKAEQLQLKKELEIEVESDEEEDAEDDDQESWDNNQAKTKKGRI
jgi:hypothetical protein